MITSLRIYAGVCLYRLAFWIQDHCKGKVTAQVSVTAVTSSPPPSTSGAVDGN